MTLGRNAAKHSVLLASLIFPIVCSRAATEPPGINSAEWRLIGGNAAEQHFSEQFVLGGQLAAAGMPSFKGEITEDDLNAIQAYILDRAWAVYDEQKEL
jgi:hypothetical protein